MVLLNNNKYRNYLKLNSGPQHPAAHGITMRFNATASRADNVKTGDNFNLGKIFNLKTFLNLKLKQFVRLLGLCLLVLLILGFSYLCYYLFLKFEFKYYLVWNNRIIIPNFAMTVSTLLLVIIIWKTFLNEQQNVSNDNVILTFIFLFIALETFLMDAVPIHVCCVQLIDNLYLVKIPTFEQYEPWAKLVFQKTKTSSENFDDYQHIAQSVYETIFTKHINFINGGWGFDTENLKNWQELYSSKLTDADELSDKEKAEIYFYKKLLATMILAAVTFRFYWWALLNH